MVRVLHEQKADLSHEDQAGRTPRDLLESELRRVCVAKVNTIIIILFGVIRKRMVLICFYFYNYCRIAHDCVVVYLQI